MEQPDHYSLTILRAMRKRVECNSENARGGEQRVDLLTFKISIILQNIDNLLVKQVSDHPTVGMIRHGVSS